MDTCARLLRFRSQLKLDGLRSVIASVSHAISLLGDRLLGPLGTLLAMRTTLLVFAHAGSGLEHRRSRESSAGLAQSSLWTQAKTAA